MDKFQVVISDGVIDFDAPIDCIVKKDGRFVYSYHDGHIFRIESFARDKDVIGLGEYIRIALKYSCIDVEIPIIKSSLNGAIISIATILSEQDEIIENFGMNILNECHSKISNGIDIVKLSYSDVTYKEYKEFSFDINPDIHTVARIKDKKIWKDTASPKLTDYYYLTFIGYLVHRGLKRNDLSLSNFRSKLSDITGCSVSNCNDYVKAKFNPRIKNNENLKVGVKRSIERLMLIEFDTSEINVESMSKDTANLIHNKLFNGWKIPIEDFLQLFQVKPSTSTLEQEIAQIFCAFP